ncbi:hypothetical protein AAY473_026970 [Plecturocebus cupreus]
MGFHHVSQAGFKLLTSSDPTASASQSGRSTGMNHCTRPEIEVRKIIPSQQHKKLKYKEMGFHHVGQADLKFLTSRSAHLGFPSAGISGRWTIISNRNLVLSTEKDTGNGTQLEATVLSKFTQKQKTKYRRFSLINGSYILGSHGHNYGNSRHCGLQKEGLRERGEGWKLPIGCHVHYLGVSKGLLQDLTAGIPLSRLFQRSTQLAPRVFPSLWHGS